MVKALGSILPQNEVIFIYKQIPNFPIYLLKFDGKEILKLCDTRLYKVEDSKMYRRKSTTNKYVELNDSNYKILDDKVYRIVNIWDNGRGYLCCKLKNRKGSKNLYVHRLVYRTFVGVIPSDKEIDHIDNNKYNNSVDNLQLLTHSENICKMKSVYGFKLKKRCKRCGSRVMLKDSVICSKCLPVDPKTGKRKRTNAQRKQDLSKTIKKPNKDLLLYTILNNSLTKSSEIFGVSRPTIRRWCIYYDLPYRRRDIEQYKKNKNSVL